MNRLTVTAVSLALVVLSGHNVLAQNGYDLFQKGEAPFL